MNELNKKFLEHIKSNKNQWLIIDFDRHSTLKHFNFIKSEIDNWLEEIMNQNINLTQKIGIALITHKNPIFNASKDSKDVDLFGDQWEYAIIENLLGTAYQSNVKFVDYKSEDLAKIIGQKVNQNNIFKVFAQSLKKIKFSQFLEEFIKNKLLPEIIKIAKEEEQQFNNSSFLPEFVKIIHQNYSAGKNIKSVSDWREAVLNFNDFERQGILNVEELLLLSQVEMFSKNLENLFLRLKKENGLFNILSWSHNSYEIQSIFKDIYIEKLNKILKMNRLSFLNIKNLF